MCWWVGWVSWFRCECKADIIQSNIKNGPKGAVVRASLATTSRDDFEAYWNRRTDDGQDQVLSQPDALTKKFDLR